MLIDKKVSGKIRENKGRLNNEQDETKLVEMMTLVKSIQ